MLAARLGRVGIDLVGATSVAAYDARVAPDRRLAGVASGARGVVVLGNGGRGPWGAVRASGAGGGAARPPPSVTPRAGRGGAPGVAGGRSRGSIDRAQALR